MAKATQHIRSAQIAAKEADNLLNGQHGPWPSKVSMEHALIYLREAASQIIEAQIARKLSDDDE